MSADADVYILATDPKESVKPNQMADVIRRLEHFARDPGGMLYVYRGGVYVPEGERTVGPLVQKVLAANGRDGEWSTRLRNESVAHILDAVPDVLERPPTDVLNLLNCLLDVRQEGINGDLKFTFTRRDHTPHFLSTVQLAVNYDPEAPQPKAWSKFLDEILPGDCALAGIVWHIIAWLMLPNMNLQIALLFMSEQAGTGKSTLLRAIQSFLGKGNIASESLQDLENNKFRAANLHGKLLNVFADLRGGKLATSNIFKVLTGQDTFSAERKYGQPFSLCPFCRLVFSTNNFPVVEDAGDSFFSRWFVIKFEIRFRGTAQQRAQDDILAELTTPKELSGVLNMALSVLPEVLRKDGGIPEPPSCVAARTEFEARTSPVAVWLRVNVVTGSNLSVEKQRLREAYNQDASSHGRPVLTDKEFSKRLWETYKSQLGEHRDSYGSRRNLWTGIGLIETGKDETDVTEGDNRY